MTPENRRAPKLIRSAQVTYTNHFVGEGPEWKVNATWLQRVSEVVDMALERGLYVLTNVHHGKNFPFLLVETSLLTMVL